MANKYWIGGTGTWDNASATNWSTTSGGAGGASAPIAGDTVFFDANSGTGTCTVTATAASVVCTLNNANIELSLSANFTTAYGFTHTAGTITLNNNVLSVQTYTALAGTKTINFSTGNITVTGSAATVINLSGSTAPTVTGTPQFVSSYTGANVRSISPSSTWTAFSYKITGTGQVNFGAGSSGVYKDIDFTGFSGTWASASSGAAWNVYGSITLDAGMTMPSQTGAITLLATSGIQKITSNGKTFDQPITQNGVGGTVQLQDNLTIASSRIYTLNNGTLDLTGNSGNWTLSCGLFYSNVANTRSVLFGTGNITITGNGGTVLLINTATGFTYTGTPNINFTYSGGTGTRSIYFGGNGGGSATNAPNIFISAGTDTVSLSPSFPAFWKDIDFTGFSGTLSSNPNTIYGNLTFSSGMTLSAGAGTLTFAGTSGTQQITTNGKTLDFPLTFNGSGGTFAFQDALTQGSTRAFTITNGTVQLKNGVTSTVGAFATSGTNQKFLQSALAGSQATLSQASGTVNVSYLTSQDINATGGATWNLVNNSVNRGNLSGWYVAHQQNAYFPGGMF